MSRVNPRRIAQKSIGGIPPKIPTPVVTVGNVPNDLTSNTVALSAKHIWTPPACKGDCRRDLEFGCSHISGLLVGRQMRPWP
jgi:hypothetical protein